MRRVVAALLLAAALGALPAAAGGNDWGTWTFAGHGKNWSGTLVDSHHVTGVVFGLRSLVKYNSVTSFTIDGTECKTSKSAGTGYCYTLDIPAGKKVGWTLTTRRNVPHSAGLVPCIRYGPAYHCRYGNG